MKIKQISFGLIGAALMSAAFASCTENKYEDSAKAQAVKYLNGDELLKAERFARQQTNYDSYCGEAVLYWDSLLLEAKAKEAYLKGQQLIKDSINGIHHRKEKYKAPLDTIIKEPGSIAENIKKEYAQYTNAEDFIKAREKAPENTHLSMKNDNAASTHYWNLITIAGKQQEAYNKGMVDERQKLNK